jgi:hypothetical protein
MSVRRRNAKDASETPERVNGVAKPGAKVQDGREVDSGLTMSQLAPTVLDIYSVCRSLRLNWCHNNVFRRCRWFLAVVARLSSYFMESEPTRTHETNLHMIGMCLPMSNY